MKIDIHPNYSVYRKTVGSDNAAAPLGHEASAGVKQDVIDITHGSTVADKAMVGMKASIHSYLATPGDPARLAELRDQIRSGAYRVETDDLVESILKG